MMHKGGFTLLGEMLYYNPIRYDLPFEPKTRGITFYEHPWNHNALYGDFDISPDTKIHHSFVSSSKKIIIFDKLSLFHLFMEILPAIVDILINYKDVEIIFNINQSQHFYKQTTFDFLKNFSGFLNSKYDNRVTIIAKAKDLTVSINNYLVTDSAFHLPEPSSVIKTRELILEFLGIESKPNKKIYLSRRKTYSGNYSKEIITGNIKSEHRVNNEEALELFFAKQGFEIIVPEEFESMVDQLRYFSQASVLVSATSSGLGNMIVMSPGTSVAEIVATIGFISTNPENGQKYLQQIFHNQYGPYCFTLGLNNARIPNADREAETIIKNIKNSKSLQGFLQIDRIVE